MSFRLKTKSNLKGSGPVQAGPSKAGDDQSKFANPRKFFNSQTVSKPIQDQQANDSAVACKVLQMQWNEKMRQSQAEPSRTYLADKKANEQKVPWTNREGNTGNLDDTNRIIDPWFVDDVWGEDLPPEALEECSKIEMTQLLAAEKSKLSSNKPNEATSTLAKDAVAELKGLVWDNWDVIDIPPAPKKLPEIRKNTAPSTSAQTQVPPATPKIHTGSKEFPTQDWKLSSSQRYLQKSTKSLPSPVATDSRAKTTEWLRNELQKKNQELSTLKEDVSTKNGENKMLREILKTTQQELEKFKAKKQKEDEIFKSQSELREKELQKQLGAFKTLAQFKEKELESYKEKCLELKKFGHKEANPSISTDESFKKFNQTFVRPGEVSLNRKSISDFNFEPPIVSVDQSPQTNVVENVVSCDILEVENDWDSLKNTLELSSENACMAGALVSFPSPLPHASRLENKGQKFAKFVKTIIDGPKPQSEVNHFLQPPMDYLSENLLFTEFSELPMENCPIRRPTLIDIWGISYHVFGQTRLDEYEKTKIGDPIKPDEALAVLGKKRFFTALDEERHSLNRLCGSSAWGQDSFDCAVKIVECVTEMAREVYASLGDPRYLHASYTINEREPRILNDLFEGSELNEDFDPLSHKPWKDECCVELRRGLVLIGVLCSLDVNITRYVFNPRQRTSAGPGKQHFVMMPNSERISLAMAGSPGQGGDKNLNQSISFANESMCEGDETVFHSLAEKLAALKNKEDKSFVTSESLTDSDEVHFKYTSIEELEKEKKLLVDSGKWNHHWERSYVKEMVKIANEKRAIIGETEPSIQELTSENAESFGSCPTSVPCKPSVHEAFLNNIKKKSKHHVHFLQSSRKKLSCEQIVLFPSSQCISTVEEKLLNKSKEHIEQTVRVIESRNNIEVPDRVDFASLFSLDDRGDREEDLFATQRKKKNEAALEEIATQILSKNKEVTKRSELKRSIGETSTSRDEQASGVSEEKRSKLEVVSFESDEKIPVHKISLSKKHSLGPLGGRSKKSVNDEKMDVDVFEEVEKMYTREAAASGSKNNELDSSKAPEIEHIPDILEKFKSKINKAGLLELMCEVIKQGGLLRYTNRLNGTMMGQVIMMQHVLKFQKIEAQKYLSKIFGILREVMYSRPSPIVVCEVHKLVNMGVSVPGFTRMLCHNSDPDKFVVNENAAYYQRGACLMEMLCILTDMLEEETNWKSAYEMSKWLHYVLTTDRLTVASWYPNGDSLVGRQCSCTVALANCSVVIFYKAALLLRHAVQLNNLPFIKKSQLGEMVELGIATLFALQEFDPRFYKKISSRVDLFKKFLEHVTHLRATSQHHRFLNLSETSLNQLKYLRANCPQDPQSGARVMNQPDFSGFHSNSSSLSDVVGLKNLLKRTHIEDD